MKTTLHFVRCRKHPESDLQTWSIPHCTIFSACKVCNEAKGIENVTDVGSVTTHHSSGENHYSKHYDKFQITISKQKGESYGAMFQRGEDTVRADPNKYAVEEFTQPEYDRPKGKR